MMQTRITRTMYYVLVMVALLGVSQTFAEFVVMNTQQQELELQVNTEPSATDNRCGNSGYYIYNETKDDCVVDFPKLMKKVITTYDSHTDEEVLRQKGLAKYIYLDEQKLFRGVLISVILFIACAAVCVLSACIYCCHINYSDRKLERDVRALAKQMHMKYPSRRQPKPKATDPKAQSCNVVVEEAGVFVV